MVKKKNRGGRGGSTPRPSGQPVEDFPTLARGGSIANGGGQQVGPVGRGRGPASPSVPTQDDFPGLGAPVGRGRGQASPAVPTQQDFPRLGAPAGRGKAAWATPSPQSSAVQGGGAAAGSGGTRGGAQPPPPPHVRGGAGAPCGSPYNGQGPAGASRGRGRGVASAFFSADEGSPASHASSPAVYHTPPQSTPGSQASPSVAWGVSPMQTPPQKPEQAIASAMGALSLEAAPRPAACNGHKNVEGITALAKKKEDSNLLSGKDIPPMRQKGYFPGTSGVPVAMEVNHFYMACTETIYTYNIEVHPPWDREFRKSDEILYFLAFQQWKKIFQDRLQNEFGWVFNGRNMIFSHFPQVKFPDVEVQVQNPVSEENVVFQITGVRQVQENDVTTIMKRFQKEGREAFDAGNEGGVPSTQLAAIDNILTQFVKTSRQVEVVGRSFFPHNMPVLDVGFGKEVWTGTFTTARPFGWKNADICLTLNVDVAHKAAVTPLNLIPIQGENPRNCYINKMFERDNGFRGNIDFTRPFHDRILTVIKKDLPGLKVRYEIANVKRSYRVNAVMQPANQLMLKDLGKTVEAYFREDKNLKLRYPHLPCLHVGSMNKTIYIPIELCRLESEPLPRLKKLNEDSVATMIRQTASRPSDRKAKIMRCVQEGRLTEENQFLKIFGISIDNRFHKVTGRVLPPPSLAYGSGKHTVKASCNIPEIGDVPGSWRVNKELYADAKAIDVIKIFNIGLKERHETRDFERTLMETGKENGVKVGEIGYYDWKSNRIPKALEECYKEAVEIKKSKKSVLIIVILDRKGSDHYEKIKFLGDKTYGIPSQCVVGNTLFKPNRPGCNRQVMQNLWLKINSKMGGKNFTLHKSVRPPWFSRPYMIMGADVSHASPESKGEKPSIVAVVGSTDVSAVKYNCSIRIQGRGAGRNEEIIQDMKEMTKELLLKFWKDNKGYKPEKIVMFRDGVSEGQFLKVLSAELHAMRAACSSLGDGSYKPPITYIVVQKRHHTRFFPLEKKYTYQRSGNAFAGTVLDKGLNHPTEGDFYLLSHEGIQGTARPTHYHVLWDDSNHSADDLETTTFYLCHLYSRCTRSVSYPAPTYYAHLAADRARKHHNQMLAQNDRADVIKLKIEDGSVPLMYFV